MTIVKDDTYTVDGLKGHWHRTLDLPQGYEHWNWYSEGENPNGVWLNDYDELSRALLHSDSEPLQIYTQHEIFLEEGILKHTRTSPNYEGGLVTYSTCKHFMRSAKIGLGDWVGRWLVGLCPKHCANNTLLFAGQISQAFPGNWWLSEYVKKEHPKAYRVKLALGNPRGDLYTPDSDLTWKSIYDHNNYLPPENHTRTVEFYKKSPGSVSDREDGKIVKWYRDLEYLQRGVRPPSFILNPCFLFSRPLLWTTKNPRRAVLRMTAGQFLQSLTLSA